MTLNIFHYGQKFARFGQSYLTRFQFWKSLRIDLWGSYILGNSFKNSISAFKEGHWRLSFTQSFIIPNHSPVVIFREILFLFEPN
jgi:hypothetical protein